MSTPLYSPCQRVYGMPSWTEGKHPSRRWRIYLSQLMRRSRTVSRFWTRNWNRRWVKKLSNLMWFANKGKECAFASPKSPRKLKLTTCAYIVIHYNLHSNTTSRRSAIVLSSRSRLTLLNGMRCMLNSKNLLKIPVPSFALTAFCQY